MELSAALEHADELIGAARLELAAVEVEHPILQLDVGRIVQALSDPELELRFSRARRHVRDFEAGVL